MSNTNHTEELLKVPRGVVGLQDRFYIERKADEWLRHQLQNPGTTTTVCGPHQSGKSSLLLRGIQQAHQHGAKIVFLDLQGFDDQCFTVHPVFEYLT